MRQDGSWPGIDYESKERSRWGTTRHLSNVLYLARAYTSGDTNLRDDLRLKKAVTRSLDYWLTHDFRNPNWWYNRIGV